MNTSNKSRVLVSAGSKHGSTAEIASRIASQLEEHGCDVTFCPPNDAGDVADFDAIVLGSAVYAGRWTADAKDLAHAIGRVDPIPAVWLFSSGPVGDPPKPDEEPVDAADILTATRAKEHRVFAGKIDKSKLGFGEKAIVMALKVPEGDFRDWDAIDRWASQIAEQLTKATSTR
ncbi:MAG TPA: flavodoxin domain-containing protein [Acidimicrobiia bacterium]|nr:flavodoxin domain-containing protein [Acidimicrobiia bacterium]